MKLRSKNFLHSLSIAPSLWGIFKRTASISIQEAIFLPMKTKAVLLCCCFLFQFFKNRKRFPPDDQLQPKIFASSPVDCSERSSIMTGQTNRIIT